MKALIGALKGARAAGRAATVLAAVSMLAFGVAAASARSGRHQARSHAARHHGRTGSHGASRSIYIKESAHLRRLRAKRNCTAAKQRGFYLYERGGASGTVKGSIYLHLCVTSTKHVVASVEVYPRGGSLDGSGSASYGVHGGTARFSGSLSITKGSGKFAGAHGRGLRFSGTIKRTNSAVSVTLDGRLYL